MRETLRNQVWAIAAGVLLMAVVLACASTEPATRKTIIVNTPGQAGLIIEPGASAYDQAYEILGGDGPQEATLEQWNMIRAFFQLTPEEEARSDRWRAQFDVHWPNVDAFNERMAAISEDRVIDEAESKALCFLKDQWVYQLTAAKEYVENYREVEPETVADNPGLGNLELAAIRGLGLLDEVECE